MARRRITSQDVARHAGVSRTTVSFVLNGVKEANISEETRRRVLAAAEELGYVPDASAQALASGRTRTIAMILTQDDPHPSASSLHFRIIEGLMEVTRQSGVRLLIDSVRQTEVSNTYLSLARTKRIDGLILSDLRVDNGALPELSSEDFPIVLLDNLPSVQLCSVSFDNRGGARKAVAHLIAAGHRRIALVAHAPTAFRGVAERLGGYQDALAEAGIPFDEELVRQGDYSPESGYAAASALLRLPETPTALFVTNDELAFGALQAIQERGLRVPDDVAVAGFDDHPLARFASPPLTTVRLPFEEMGRQAGALLLGRIRREIEPGRSVVLEGELVVRRSSVRQSDAQPADAPQLPT